MLRQFRLFGALVFILGFITSSAWGQHFSDVVVFGDSLSDSGNIGGSLGLPPGSSFTTNPDPVWSEIVAETYGASGTNSRAGGSNYAVGGACVNPNTPGTCNRPLTVTPPTLPTPPVTDQVAQYFMKTNGQADPNALYAVWGGSNDILDSSTADAANVQSHTVNAAVEKGRQIRRLQKEGARHILVFNLPALGRTPDALALPPSLQGALSALGAAYNQTLYAALSEREEGIIPINVFGFMNEVIATPGTYGFTNVTGTACGGQSLLCGPQGSGSPVTYQAGANRSYVFADGKHPTGAAHEMLASLVTSTLAAPVLVSLAGEGGVEIAGIHRSAVSAERMTDLGLDRSVGSVRTYVTGRFGRYQLKALPRLGETRADAQVLTLGANHRPATNLWWGAALSIGRYDNGASGARLDSTALIGSLHGMWRRGGLHVSGALNAGGTSMDIKRSITLGPTVRAEQGSSRALQFGVDVDAGWTLGGSDDLQHGPFLGVAWINQTVDGYREDGNRSTAMTFSGFRRDSLITRVGYRVMKSLEWKQAKFRPYADVFYAKEFMDDPISVTAGSKTMPGRFTLSGFTPPRHWASTDLGLVMTLYDNVNVFAGYTGRFGTESRRDHRLNLGLNVTF